MSNKAVGLSALVLAVVVGGIVWMQEARKNEASQHGVSSEKNKSSTEKMSGSSGLAASAQSFTQSSASSIRHPFPEIPRTRDGMSFENDPGFAESKAEQKWLDRHGYPNEKQLEAYMLAPEALLKQAAEAGDIAAQAMLDARLLPTDPKAQQRLVDAGAEGNLFALNMLASYQGGSANGDPVAAYAVSRVAEMRGDARAGITREVMIAKPLTTEQKMLGESEALRLNQAINQIYISKHGVAPILDKRPIGGQ
ncbi:MULTISPECIES: hypothetical protein [Xanthomonas]|uniref:hypothetical protein n=1 Tax=Xanthomonas TaxID=338 RepID=UPI001D15515A|nr:hypothetical protein [Xanthomonas campestris]MCC3255068.1 hypothetical protein [Xanthomonas campestris pv. armoraciae]MCE4552073.1 hypothetical protein [Xanthomonas hortorum pv. vitians]WHO91424.1 hypothetical protein QMY62_14025 [Xanthomonas campestris]